MITVFTPVYNRAHLLPRLYESLCRQTFKDFEWVIVDDGSSDDTRSVVEKFSVLGFELSGDKAQSLTPPPSPLNPNTIRYFYQENGGKHRAINRGVEEARGDLFLILDSDDTLPERSLEWINHYYQQIKDDTSFGGVCGYMAHHDGTIIGTGNNASVLDTNTIDLRYRYGVKGDMCEVFKTSVMKLFPFPDISGEKFCPEALVLFKIAKKYKLRVFHEVIYYRDYLDGGLTDRIVRIRMESPLASMLTYKEMLESNGVGIIRKCELAINYYRFRLCSKNNQECPHVSLSWSCFFPVGWLMHKRDLRKFR